MASLDDHAASADASASVEPPDAHYQPALPESLLRGERGYHNPAEGWERHAEGALSAAQLETLVYAVGAPLAPRAPHPSPAPIP